MLAADCNIGPTERFTWDVNTYIYNLIHVIEEDFKPDLSKKEM